jgi:hypothetical protein
MLSFKFIETFFFLSLGITFALIITLVYHFKKRMENMETKCDTMFDIVQNLAKEVLDFKRTAYVEQPMVSMPLEQVAYDTLDDVINNSTNNNHYGSDEDDSDEDNSDEDDSDEDNSDEDDSDEDNSDEDDSDEDGDETNILSSEKITIPNNDANDSIRVIDLSEQVILLPPQMDEHLVVSEFIDEDETMPVELNAEDFLSVNKVLGESDINEIYNDTEGDVTGSNLSKSALRKLKLAQLKQIATGKQITVDDAMTKTSIIDILLAN